jgi:hypothetical protein
MSLQLCGRETEGSPDDDDDDDNNTNEIAVLRSTKTSVLCRRRNVMP